MRILVQVIGSCAFIVSMAACGHAPAPRPSPTNPISFPLYGGSAVLSVRSWHHALTSGERAVLGIAGSAGGAYAGHEVLAATPDSFENLDAWLQALNNLPPQGYRVALWGNGVDEARIDARTMGFDFGAFTNEEHGVRHDVAVIVVDPDLVQRKAGIMISLLGRYKDMPPFLRAAVDAQAKSQTGFTVSEAMDPATPIGIAFDSLERLHGVHARGVILVDMKAAPKQR